MVGALETRLQPIVSCQMVLGIEPGYSGRAVSVLNGLAIISSLRPHLKKTKQINVLLSSLGKIMVDCVSGAG